MGGISHLCYVTMETIWKNTGGFVDGKYQSPMLCYYGDDIKMDLKEIGVDVMSQLRIEITGEPFETWHGDIIQYKSPLIRLWTTIVTDGNSVLIINIRR